MYAADVYLQFMYLLSLSGARAIEHSASELRTCLFVFIYYFCVLVL